MRLYWLLGALILAVSLAVVHQVALTGYLYWHFPWFDTFVHALGGACAGTLLIGLFPARHRLGYLFWCAVLFAAWEFFEYSIGVYRAPNFRFDTALDLLMDTLGGIIPYIIARYTIWR